MSFLSVSRVYSAVFSVNEVVGQKLRNITLSNQGADVGHVLINEQSPVSIRLNAGQSITLYSEDYLYVKEVQAATTSLQITGIL